MDRSTTGFVLGMLGAVSAAAALPLPNVGAQGVAPQRRPLHPSATPAGLAGALGRLTLPPGAAGVPLMRAGAIRAIAGPTPHQVPAPVANAALAQVGKAIFFDTNLSNPPGLACASCHAPAAGFAFPGSTINATLGEVPGAVPGRFGNRKPPTISYAAFSPPGPQLNPNIGVYVGGQFWDGRASSLVAQVPFPIFNPNEMNDLTKNVADPSLVVQKIARAPYAKQFRQVFGANVFSLPAAQVMGLVAQAVAAWESTPEVSPFSSKYDAYRAGLVALSPSELNGLRLFTGSMTGRPGGPPAPRNAQCVTCHAIPADPSTGPDLFTAFVYVNDGVPKNPKNPYYAETDARSNPLGYNPLGAAYVDLGLGDFLYPANNLPAGNIGPGSNGQGDFLAVNGTFKAPTLRNVDRRPNPGFVKAYMHNGVFKSLEQVVHFYNARNLTTQPGEVIDFTRPNPYAGLRGTPLFAPPEYPSPVTLVNPSGAAAGAGGLVGNLTLSAQDEADLVAFLRTLSDGFGQPGNPPPGN